MKDRAVRAMFETIAGGYDFQNSFLSMGRDIHWRRELARAIRLNGRDTVLDVAAGTAEVAVEICRRHRLSQVIAVDFSPAMLEVGRKKIGSQDMAERIHLSVGDGRRLPIRGASVDAVTMAFGIRNIEERRLALEEFYRVLKPGGQLFIMEFSYPEGPVLGRLYRFYFNRILPPLGNWISRTDYAYSYLAESVRDFPGDRDFLGEMEEAGFGVLGVQNLTFGIAKIFKGVKGVS